VVAGLPESIPELFVFKGQTPLHLAMAFGRPALVTAMLDRAAAHSDGGLLRRATTAVDDVKGYSPLMWACIFDRTANVSLWLARFPKWDLSTRGRGFNGGLSALGLAVSVGASQSDTVAVLLQAKADPAFVADDGFTLLHLACMNVDIDVGVVRLLLGRSQRPPRAILAQRLRGLTAAWSCMYAMAGCIFRACGKHSRIANMVAGAVGAMPIHLAVVHGDAPLVRTLLEAHADPMAETAVGQTPLMRARAFGPFPVVEQLLRDFGARA